MKTHWTDHSIPVHPFFLACDYPLLNSHLEYTRVYANIIIIPPGAYSPAQGRRQLAPGGSAKQPRNHLALQRAHVAPHCDLLTLTR